MSSDRYLAERTPWYLSGALDEEESAEIQRLLAASEENRQELTQTRAAARIYGHRLPSEVLVSYAFDGGHPDIPTELLERYLAVSPVASGELELVRESQAALQSKPATERLVEGAGPFQMPAVSTPVTGWRRMAIAASILGVTFLGLAGWQWLQGRDDASELAQARQQLRELLAREDAAATDEELGERLLELESENTQLAAGKSDLVDQVAQRDSEINRLSEQIADLALPQLNIPVIDLFPGDMILRGEEETDHVVVVPRQMRSVALILNSSTSAEQQVSSLIILDADDKEVWRSQAAPERDELGTFTVALTVQKLEAGRYTLQLVDLQDGQTRVVETYTLEIR